MTTSLALFPDATIVASVFAPVGAPTIHEALDDLSCTEYVEIPAAGDYPDVFVQVAVDDVVVPAGAIVESVQGFAFLTSFLPVDVAATDNYQLSVGAIPYEPRPVGASVVTTQRRTRSPATGERFSPAELNALQLRMHVRLGRTGSPSWCSAYFVAELNLRPVVVLISPCGAIVVGTARPTVLWVYVDPDTTPDPAERFRVKWFLLAGAPDDYDTETIRLVEDSGEVFSASTGYRTRQSLPDGTYHVAVKVADVGSGGRYSDWVGCDFQVDNITLLTPGLACSVAPVPVPCGVYYAAGYCADY